MSTDTQASLVPGSDTHSAPGRGTAGTARAVPFYCPFCSDEDLRPFDPTDGSAGHGQWRCRSCQRVFALKYLGLAGGWDQEEPPAAAPDLEGGSAS